MHLAQVQVHSPNSLDEALLYLSEHCEDCRVISGGTDVLIELKENIRPSNCLLSLHKLHQLRYVRLDGETVKIGALTTITDLLNSPLIRSRAPSLHEAGLVFGSIQVRDRATLVGNVGRASPAGDCIPPLYTLDASVVLQSAKGSREVPVEEFFLGPRRTAMKSDELIVEVRLKGMSKGEVGFFEKLGLRNANAISVVSVAAYMKRRKNSDMFETARIALGSVAPTVIRARRAEELLTSTSMDEGNLRRACEAAAAESRPISDVRGSAEYRRSMVSSVLFKGLHRILGR